MCHKLISYTNFNEIVTDCFTICLHFSPFSAKFVLDGDVDVNSGRKTRSQSRGDVPKPAVKKAGTMQKTAKEGKEFLNRGKGKKGKAAPTEAAAAVNEDKEEDKSDS